MSALEKETDRRARRAHHGRAAHRLDARRSRGAVRAAVQRSAVLGAMGAPAELRSERRAGLDVAVDQDGRVPRGLRVLPAEHSFRDGHRHARSDAARRRCARRRSARRTPARRGSAWARRTAGRRIRSSSRSSRWSRRSRRSGSRRARRSGLLRPGQAERLADAGLDYYNHNLDSSAEFYEKIISTRTYADRLETLERVRAAGVKVCCGGIVGMGETRADRVGMLHTLATLAPQPESVPINELVPIPGTPLAERRAARSVRVRALHRRRADPDAALARPAVGGPQRVQRRAAGAVLLRRRELDLLRREAADDGQSRHGRRSAAVRRASAWRPSRARRG